jgi:LysM repeat protein/lysophospholipase L1-like esterase
MGYDLKQRFKILFFLPIAGLMLSFAAIPGRNPMVTPPSDSLCSPSYINNITRYQRYYPFIRYEQNYVEWESRNAVDSFFRKLGKTNDRKLKIYHIGDSHLQSDFPTGYMRERLQEIFGYGGRGLVFPYKAAATHAAYDYKTSSTGNWEYTRNTLRETKYDMGLIGAVIHTTDTNAGFRIIFREGYIRPEFTKIKLYCKQDTASFDVVLKYSDKSPAIHIDCNQQFSELPYITIDLASASDTLDVSVRKTASGQRFFECYGLLIESRNNSGLLYNTTGINGAGYTSVLKQRLLGLHLSELSPDLVVLDLGANDFYGGAYNSVLMESNLRAILDIIRQASPGSAILISNSQDIYYRRKRDIVECEEFMQMTRRLASEKECIFYNYYDISGGKASMNLWLKNGLAKADKIHLTAPGYYVRGELMMNAILNSYALWLQDSVKERLQANDFVLDTTRLKKYFSEEINFEKEKKGKEPSQIFREPELSDDNDSEKIYYRIKNGDNLGSIAEKFGVSVRELQYWNSLSGSKIIAGETLIIYKKGSNAPQPVQVKENREKQTPHQDANLPSGQRNSSRKGVYKVVSGDTLWSIAQKHNTTVEKIKVANNLKSDKLSIGQTLIIP